MLSALIPSQHGYPAVPLAGQLAHQRLVPRGPLVLSGTPLKARTLAADRDRPVSRRSEPNSRVSLMGEQPNPWELLHPQDETSRHRFPFSGKDYAFIPHQKFWCGRPPLLPASLLAGLSEKFSEKSLRDLTWQLVRH